MGLGRSHIEPLRLKCPGIERMLRRGKIRTIEETKRGKQN
jgi:hypothetical protein